MPDSTKNYELLKPRQEEFYDVDIPNYNMDKIDSALKKHDDLLGKKVDLDETGKIPQEQLPELDFIPKSDIGQPNGVAPLNEDGVLDIQYGGTGAKTKKQACDNLDAMSAVCAYYSGEDSDGILDTSTESTIIIPITRDINADLYNLIGGNWGYVYQTFFDEKTTATRRVQLVISTGTGKIACRQYDITLQKWQDWTVQATTQKPIEHDLALADGFIANHGCKYFKTQDNVVTLFLDTRNTSLFGPQETVIATLPSGFRPIKALTVPGTCVAKNADTGQYQPCVGKLYTNGNISIYTATTNTPLEYAVISCSFVAGN